MILYLAEKYRKPATLFMLTIFTIQLLFPVLVAARMHVPVRTKTDLTNRSPFANTVQFHSNNDNKQKASLGKVEEGPVKQPFIDASMAKTTIGNGSPLHVGGPGQPEMSSFQSVNGNNMVDLFTGDFSYNIPLMDVGGYPLNIHYTGGITMDQEASWVGLGFNLNPGAINRNMRGLPDDFNGTDSITKTQNIRENKTVGVKLGAQAEFVGSPLTAGVGIGVFHNNYNGWGIEQSLNAAISLGRKNQGDLNGKDSLFAKGPVKIGAAFNNNSQTGLMVSPSLNVILKKYDEDQLSSVSSFGINTGYHTRAGLSALTINATKQKFQPSLFRPNPMWGGSDVNISFVQPSVTPFITMPTTSQNFTFHTKIGFEAYGMHGNVFVEGYVNKQKIDDKDRVQKLPAYGYLYFTNGNGNNNALLDFNREKELQFNYQSTPHIAIPQYTYDVYSISGEGIGGTIRPYRGDAGYIRDHHMRTRNGNKQFSLEFGGGSLLHGGFSYDYVNAYTENNSWTSQNNMAQALNFQRTDQLYESVYFRNPGEKTSNSANYYKQIGDDDLVRVKLNRSSLSNVSATNSFVRYQNGKVVGEVGVSGPLRKENRDKRSQVVTYLNAAEASVYGFERSIQSYKENSLPLQSCSDTVEKIKRVDGTVHKPGHLSEIDVLNGDGRRYIYGIPAYNIEQKDVTFSVDKETNAANVDSGFVAYSQNDRTVDNDKGKEHYYNEEKIPAYAHSFLLTAILSPDYVDVTGDGVTEDDLGDGIKFNYTRVYGPNQDYYAWRTPGSNLRVASYNEGLKTYNRDDKGTFSFGKKEVWYVHSVESKTMIALFKVSADRQDAYAAAGEDGGINTNKALRRLDRIELYAKADLLKNKRAARPIKTVHFEYDYALCKKQNGTGGKLTLQKIWFSYNGNEKGKQNPYVFQYSSFNPAYHPKKYDRWGNYKDADGNPGQLNNADFPYVVQDSVTAARNASAWQLTDIKLPSGGRMKITYEADDYAFVQNKRAMQMFSLAGFGKTPTATPTAQLYDGDECEYVFVDSDSPLNDANTILKTYLQGNEWIYMKLAVNMPPDRWGSGYEFIPVYGKLAAYGKVAGLNRFWLKFEKVDGISPALRSAFQFLKNNLPSKAYPTSELGDNVDLGDAVKMLLSSIGEVKKAVLGFEKAGMTYGWCKNVVLPKSFLRLNAPSYKKIGGGSRVKRIEIFDNWNQMTNQRESVYGQEYDYRTSIEVDGHQQVISSGVASYEPMIGGEENPFRQPINYAEKIAPLAPVSFLYSEMPLCESYFPGAAVGYSKVRVRTINAKAKSANGWEETEFYTTKDFPTLVEHTLLDQDAKTRYAPRLQNLLKIYSVDRVTVSQGFKVELNDMNGKVKRTASYAENDSINPMSYTLNFYRVNDEKAATKKLSNTVWTVDSANGFINKNGMIGKDIEIINDFRQQFSSSVSGGISPNLDLFQIGFFPIPIPSLFKFPQYDESQFRSAATVKLIQRYGILDSVVVKDKSSVVSTKNLLYDGETGEVVLSRTQNEFNDPVYNFSYPAHWAYSGMGMAYQNVHGVFSNLKLVNGKLYYPGNNTPFPVENFFESGDEVWLNGFLRRAGTDGNCMTLYPIAPMNIPLLQKAWVIDASKATETNQGLFFIDQNGKPISGEISRLKILRSGRRNLLNASVGSVLSMGNPIRQVSSDSYRLLIDSTISVINASATTYKDIWKVEQSFYAKDTVVQVTTYGSRVLEPTITTRRMVINERDRVMDESSVSNSRYAATSFDYLKSRSCVSGHYYFTKSLLQFDFSQIPSNATITSAGIQFSPSVPNKLWWRMQIGNGNLFCPTTYSYDWSQATNYYLGQPAATLKRITNGWNANTPYLGIYSAAANAASVSENNYSFVDCRGLIQDMLTNRNFGIVFELNRKSVQSNISETNYLSFCGNSSDNSGVPCDNTYAASSTTRAANFAAQTCPCFKPQLYVSWSASVDTVISVCRPNIDTNAANPYRWGIVGNWRIDRAYTYYSDRKERDANIAQTDIRREGVLNAWTPFWKFASTAVRADADSTKWVWNSAMSAYNRKGFETENYDPLGRYNAGLYAYNETLPVAVAQNSRYREILSDGFEDYGYKTKYCVSCDNPREVDFVKGQTNVSLVDEDSHSGRYSLKVLNGAEAKLTVPLATSSIDDPAQFSMRVDSTKIYSLTVVGKGTGLSGDYLGYRVAGSQCIGPDAHFYRIDPVINFSWSTYESPISGMCLRPNRLGPDNYIVTWTGKVQAKHSGNYTFTIDKGYGAAYLSVSKANTTIAAGTSSFSQTVVSAGPLYLDAGELCTISLQLVKKRENPTSIRLSWSSESISKELIPVQYLYPSGTTAADTVGSVVRAFDFYCIKPRNIMPLNPFRPVFAPSIGSRMVASAWVKIAGADCQVADALSDVVIASFDNGSQVSLQKTGNRIEGWQRYESVVDIPVDATIMYVRLKGAGRTVYVDDVRVQPYNSNMKAYAYDPVSLRLMAELDENNYAGFYEYDDDGTLIRVKKETEKGILTVKETRSALLKD